MLSPTNPGNGIFLHNNNLLLDPAITILNGDFTYQLYYSTTDILQKTYIFYIGNTNGFIPEQTPFGVFYDETGALKLYFKSSLGTVSEPNITVDLGYTISNSYKCYSFVKLGNRFRVYVNDIEVYNNSNILSTMVMPNYVDYFCTCPTNNNIVTGNFFRFYNLGLAEQYVFDYYNYRFPTSGTGLLFNIEGVTDYSTTGVTIETDLTYSSLVTADVCAVV